MKRLITQPTAAPTRKLWAVIATGAIMGGVTATVDAIPALAPAALYLDQAEVWVTAGLMALAGYMTRDRA
ncbi:hypothetical protein [Jannaschia formosa]|uniref:hypothetical protein n=1 Tax=Jannaschia formosa TaxID=2259592 RepID=UPI000E1BF9AF|nr:hypothetical protein [Jannaschia formosa]TFL16447.1 hypothetical protein DR046_20210 [Jannaschia formosa]